MALLRRGFRLPLTAGAFLWLILAPMLSACASTATAPPSTSVSGEGGAPTVTAPAGMATVRVSDLPEEARHTLALIAGDGPFPYSQDGAIFQNREKLLPKEASGYYHEYTVITPGSNDRGARRIIAGKRGERYYTGDHYDSFRWIAP